MRPMERNGGEARLWPDLLRCRSDLAALRFQLAAWRVGQFLRKYNFDPNQPRLPRGAPGGGRWTAVPGAESPPGGDAVRVAQSGGRGPVFRIVATPQGRYPATPRQEASYAAAELQANAALRFVRTIDPRWQPRPSIYETIDGAIAHQRDVPR